MSATPSEARRRAEWERIRARGLTRYLLVRGILLRGVPMAIAVILLLTGLRGGSLDRRALLAPDFLARVVVAVLLFSVGGMVSAYARWRSLDLRFGDRDESGSA